MKPPSGTQQPDQAAESAAPFHDGAELTDPAPGGVLVPQQDIAEKVIDTRGPG